MTNLHIVLYSGILLLILIFGTHYLRTWAFNRHEAITFECSSVAFLISLLLIWRYGFSRQRVLLCGLLLLMFAANAILQWHFYMVLQDIIRDTFGRRAKELKGDPSTAINRQLYTMASVAIMPSFSRFIEESGLFNNPGSLIGLAKSLMRRQRFQKKKYRMREAFSENVSLIGPCTPLLKSDSKVETFKVSGAVHPDDLALPYSEEKKGLLSYDLLGFGGLLVIWAALTASVSGTAARLPLLSDGTWEAVFSGASILRAAVLFLILILFTLLTHLLRHIGFARYESIFYEASCSVFIAAAFLLFDRLTLHQNDQTVYSLNALSSTVSAVHILLSPGLTATVLLLLLLLFSSFENRRLDKRLHAGVEATFDRILNRIPPDSEVQRVQRKFLQNLKTISEWTLVPLPEPWLSRLEGSDKIDRSGNEKTDSIRNKIAHFNSINLQKRAMPEITAELASAVAPGAAEEAAVLCTAFSLPDTTKRSVRHLGTALGIASLFLIALFAAAGIF